MNIIQRVKDILLTPKQTWPVIESESTDTATLYTQYIMILALIPAVAEFIGRSVISYQAMRVPLINGLITMVVDYVVSLAMTYVVALIADALAPSFGGQKNLPRALRLIAYASTANWLGGLFTVLPGLSALRLLALLLSIYQIFLGIPVMMKSPLEKSLPYTVVLLICALIAGTFLTLVAILFR